MYCCARTYPLPGRPAKPLDPNPTNHARSKCHLNRYLMHVESYTSDGLSDVAFSFDYRYGLFNAYEESFGMGLYNQHK